MELESSVRRFFDQTASAKRSRHQVPVNAFGVRQYCIIHQAGLVVILSSLFLLLAIVLEWTEEYPGGVRKPVPVRWAGIAFKMVELLLGAAAWGYSHWAAASTKGYNVILYFAKGLITALEIPIKGTLIIRYVPRTTLASPTDWFNLLCPSILALYIIIMDTTKLWLSILGGDDGGANNEFLPFTKLGDRYEVLAQRPYPGTGLDRSEKVVLIEALLWGS